MDLNNKVIAVTGGARGLGFAMAKALAEKGAHIALLDMNEEQLKAASEQLPNSRYYVTNVSQEDEVEATFASIWQDFGALNGLVNNAGIIRDGLMVKGEPGNIISEMSLADWQAVINVNLTGVFLCGRAAAKLMIEHAQEACILNISSISAGGNFGQSNYSAAKAGVESLTKVWTKELARHKIRCVCIAPGFILTEMVASMNQNALAKLAAQVPAGRGGQPDEVGALAVSLFENDFMSGAVYNIHGGFSLPS